jgi:hypothetical protein
MLLELVEDHIEPFVGCILCYILLQVQTHGADLHILPVVG